MNEKTVKYDSLGAMWSFVQMGGYRLNAADISSLKENCELLRRMLTQKTAGQRQDKPRDVDFRELDAVTNNITIGAMVLYLSGTLDKLAPAEVEK